MDYPSGECYARFLRDHNMKNIMIRTKMYFGAAGFMAALIMATGVVRAQGGHTCVYANDQVFASGGINAPNTVDGYLITSTSQTYLPPVETGGQSNSADIVQDIVTNPTLDVLYAADANSGDVAVMTIHRATCQLTLLTNVSLGHGKGNALSLAISPNGKWLYVVATNTHIIYGFDILQDGSLTAIRQKLVLLNRVSGIAISPDNSTLVMGIPKRPGNGEELFSYSIDQSTGMLTQVSKLSPRVYPGAISFDAQSKYVYVASGSYGAALEMAMFEVGAGSTLTFVRTDTFSQTDGSISSLRSINGKYLYLTNQYLSTITTLGINSDTGRLKYISTVAGATGDGGLIGLATDASGKDIFVANSNFIESSMEFFAAANNGTLTLQDTLPIGPTSGESPDPAWLAAKTF